MLARIPLEMFLSYYIKKLQTEPLNRASYLINRDNMNKKSVNLTNIAPAVSWLLPWILSSGRVHIALFTISLKSVGRFLLAASF